MAHVSFFLFFCLAEPKTKKQKKKRAQNKKRNANYLISEVSFAVAIDEDDNGSGDCLPQGEGGRKKGPIDEKKRSKTVEGDVDPCRPLDRDKEKARSCCAPDSLIFFLSKISIYA